MDEVGGAQLHQEGRNDIGEEYNPFRYIRTNQIKSGGEDYDIEDIIDET